MKKTGRYLILTAFVLVCALLNLIIFLTVKDARLESGVFWLGWSFAFPLNLLIAGAVCWWTSKGDGLIRMTVAQTVSYAAFAVYLVLGLIFMYLPIEKIVLPLILELIVTVVYIIAVMYFVYGASYIEKNQKETKAKVLYIRMLQADVDDCLPKTADAEVVAALKDLSESVRFSDPMSHPALGGVESELSATVAAISAALDSGDNVKATELIGKTKALLESRNKRCIMLK